MLLIFFLFFFWTCGSTLRDETGGGVTPGVSTASRSTRAASLTSDIFAFAVTAEVTAVAGRG